MLIAEKKIVSCEWDGGWFCESCWGFRRWKEKAYVVDGKKYCKNCLTKIKVDVII